MNPNTFDRATDAKGGLYNLVNALSSGTLRADETSVILCKLRESIERDIISTAARSIDRDSADDVCQKVLVSFWRQLESLDPRTLVVKYGLDLTGLVPTARVAARHAISAEARPRSLVRRGAVSMSTPCGEDSNTALGDLLHSDAPATDDDSRLDLLDVQRAVRKDVRDVLRGHGTKAAERRLREVLDRFLVNECGYTVAELQNHRWVATELRDPRLLGWITEILGEAMVRWITLRFHSLAPQRSKGQIGGGSRKALEYLCSVTGRVAPNPTVRAR